MASAVDTSHSSASPSAGAFTKLNAIPHETAVVATGARPGKSGERELFTEETTTVLVFENGGVLRLTAAVVPGQLLFLTNKATRREVVTQVTRKRDFRPTSCYVEVEFSEPSPGFWGIDFPATPQQLAPVTAHQKEAAELVQSAKVISGKRSAPAPTTGEVASLKQEVEKLREQLTLLQTQTAAAPPPAPVAATEPPPHAPVAVAPAPQPLHPPAVGEAPVARSHHSPIAASESPSSAPPLPPPAASALPVEPGGSFSDALHAQKPVIRVHPRAHSAPAKAKGAMVPAGQALRLALLSAALFFAAVGAAWYLHWIPGSEPAQKSTVSSPNVSIRPASTSVSAAKPADTLSNPAPAAAPPAVTTAPQLPASSKDAATSSAIANADPPESATAAVDPSSSPDPSALPAKRAATRPSMKTASVPTALPSEGASTVPPKLLKSVRAIASPNSLEYFAHDKTATVTLAAVVDSSGHVKSVKVISGPASLRDAAIDALKQYRYQPATSHGKPVAARVTVPIKFIFEPY